jgi:hypothetical protein
VQEEECVDCCDTVDEGTGWRDSKCYLYCDKCAHYADNYEDEEEEDDDMQVYNGDGEPREFWGQPGMFYQILWEWWRSRRLGRLLDCNQRLL